MYGEQSKAAVLLLKAEGKSDRAIGRMGTLKLPTGEMVDLPSRDAIGEWCDENHSSYDAEFSRQYLRACEDSLWDEHEKLREISHKVEQGLLEPQAAKVISDNIKWDLARRLRHVFGDNAQIDVTSKGQQVSKPVSPEDIAAAALILKQKLEANE